MSVLQEFNQLLKINPLTTTYQIFIIALGLLQNMWYERKIKNLMNKCKHICICTYVHVYVVWLDYSSQKHFTFFGIKQKYYFLCYIRSYLFTKK